MSEINYKQVAEDVRNISRIFASVSKLGEALDAVGSIQQAEKEAELRAAKAKKITEEALAASNKARAELDKLNENIVAAKEQAKLILIQADSKAADIVTAAKDEAAKRLSEADAKVAEKAVELKVFEAAIEEARERQASVDAEFNSTQNKLDKLKAQAAKLLEA